MALEFTINSYAEDHCDLICLIPLCDFCKLLLQAVIFAEVISGKKGSTVCIKTIALQLLSKLN